MTTPSKRWFGYGPPLLKDGRFASFQADALLIKNNILMLLLTRPGERIMRASFGSGLMNMMFQNATTSNLDDLRRGIYSTIVTYEKRVAISLDDIIVRQSEQDGNVLNVKITPSLNLDGDQETIEIEFGVNPDTGSVQAIR